MKPVTLHNASCWLCGRTISPEMCKVDEYGFPVHGACIIAVNAFKLQVKPAQAFNPVCKAHPGEQQ